MYSRSTLSTFVAGVLGFCFLATFSRSQEYTSYQREQAQAMLRDVADDVKKHYYDPKFHGLDWEANVREAKEKIDKATSLNMALSEVAATLDHLHDSHTFFVPPPRPYLHDYGFQMQMIGDRCYVTRVRPGSDPEAKGLKAGDEIITVNGYTPTRDDFWRIEYIYRVLRPQPGLRLKVRKVSRNEDQTVDVVAKFIERPLVRDITGSAVFDIIREIENETHAMRVRYADKGEDLLVVKLPEFDLGPSETDSVIAKMKKYKGVILDLRGNPGGSEETLRNLLGGLFDNDLTIGERLERNTSKVLEVKSRHRGFSGKLVVLVDSASASASELLARVIQLEKRGSVLGDHSSGSVMEARQYSYRTGIGTFVAYGASVTQADFKMKDGQSLEHRGVAPDTLVLPTSSDLATDRDPVAAQAAEMLGVKITPEESGKFFPYEWPKQ